MEEKENYSFEASFGSIETIVQAVSNDDDTSVLIDDGLRIGKRISGIARVSSLGIMVAWWRMILNEKILVPTVFCHCLWV